MTVWGIYEVVLHVDVPYPSIADVFSLSGYLPAFIGMEQFIWFFRKELTPGKLAVAALAGLAIVFTSSVLLLYPLITESADILTKFFDVVYPLLDTLLIVLAVMMVLCVWLSWCVHRKLNSSLGVNRDGMNPTLPDHE
jgi:hypothetical protein